MLTGSWQYHRADNRWSPQYFGRTLESLYDLNEDISERNNLAAAQPLLTAYLRALSRSNPNQVQSIGNDTAPDAETIRQLKALGYLQ